MKKPALFLLFGLLCIISFAICYSQLNAATNTTQPVKTSAPDVNDIMLNVENRDDGDDLVYTFEMTLIDRKGNRRKRTVQSFFKDFGEDRYGFIYFKEPSYLRGTAFLTFDYDKSQKEDDQWIYLPALKKSKRIGSSDKTASFVGSDITFADLTDRKVKDYYHRLIDSTALIRGHETWMVEQIPKEQREIDKFGYIKALHYVHKESYLVIRSIFWLKDNHRLKYYDLYNFKKIDGVWTQLDFSFTTTTINGHVIHRTEGRLGQVKYNQNLATSIFTVSQLEAGLPN